MGRHDLVQCQCCGKMMVPRVIETRGLDLGPIRVGEGVVGSICPFCLSESWRNGASRTVLSVFLGGVFAWYIYFIVTTVLVLSSGSWIIARMLGKLDSIETLILVVASAAIGVAIAELLCRSFRKRCDIANMAP